MPNFVEIAQTAKKEKKEEINASRTYTAGHACRAGKSITAVY